MDMQELRRLEERAKELECVYVVDKVLQDRSLTLSDAMTQLTELIPAGFSNPAACRVHIRLQLQGGDFETPGYSEAEPLYSAKILLEDDPVGELSVGYVRRLLDEDFGILSYEIKLIDTIALRISQLTLGRQRELTLLLNMLRQVDPDMLLRIGEKLRVHLEHTVGREASTLFADFGSHSEAAYGEVNEPTLAAPSLNAEAFARKLVEGASAFLPQNTIFRLLSEWIGEQRVLAFVKTVDRRDSTVSDILDAVRKYTGSVSYPPDSGGGYSQTETWLLSELTHRFLSNDENLINMVLDNLHIHDFEPMIEHIIGSERTTGNIGGKGAGLFIASQILRHAALTDPLLGDIKTPRTWYLATDQIVDFLHYNNLEDLSSYKYNPISHLRMTYDNVVQKIKNASLPPQTVNMLRVVLDDLPETPLIVRSSSLLEDRFNGSFSGKYKSLFLCNSGSRKERLDALTGAILEVYSSMYNPDSIQYRRERGLLNFTEQMGVLIQEVVGQRIGNYFMPHFGGVAFSNNLLRWSSRITPEDGLVRLVMGLGTRAVDRVNNDYPIMFAAGQPQLLINQTPADVRHYSPKQIDLIDLEKGCFATVDATDFLRAEGGKIPGLNRLVSVYSGDLIEEKNAFSLNPSKDDMVITFRNLLSSTELPKKIKRMLDVLSEKIQSPVDIEFAYDGEQLYLLQCRPQGTGLMSAPAPIPQNLPLKDILFTADRFISDGQLSDIAFVVYVDGDAYNALTSREELLAVGEAVGFLNDTLPRRKYILAGPGRWGSRGDIKLGVRVTYSDISGTAALIEVAKEKHSYVPELSFGTHFFQDLVEADILYIPLYPGQSDTVFNERFFLGSENLLPEIAPKFGWLSDVIKVIDIREASRGRTLSVHMNSQLGKAVAFFAEPQEKPGQDTSGQIKRPAPAPSAENRREHWMWRNYMAQQIAASADIEAFGVKGIYLFGSTNTGDTGIGSDIDMLFHVDEDRDGTRIPALRQWLDGWSRALARINFLQTGHDAETLLDIHIVTDADITAGNSFAIKITSTTDPATPLRLKK